MGEELKEARLGAERRVQVAQSAVAQTSLY